MNENQKSHSFEKNLKKMIETFIKAEKNKKENDLKYISWIKTICSSNFNLVSDISFYINDKKINHEIRENIIKILKKLILFEDKNIINQLNENEKILNYFSKYLMNHDLNKISENFIFLFCKILKKKNYNKILNEKIIKKLFLSLEIINNEELIFNVVWKLIKINFYCYNNNDDDNKNNKNIFIKVFNEIKLKRVFIEFLLNVLNKEIINEKKIKQILLCLFTILNEFNEFVFYSNDFDIFIDIFIKNLEITSNFEIKLFFLKIFNRIISNFPLDKNKIFRKNEIIILLKELNDENFNNDDNNKEIKMFINDILIKINS